MRFDQRMFARLKFLDKLAELHENAFESFFHDLMCARYPDYVDVRTAGSLGDGGADGLSLHSDRLYACYAPHVFSATKVVEKFYSDLDKALAKRAGQFGTFVFVHNDLRGMHPEVAGALATARVDHATLAFEQMGGRSLWHEIMQLERHDVEGLLGCPIPIDEAVYGIGQEDLAPLLEHLTKNRLASDPLMPLPVVSENKLDFNKLDNDSKAQLLRALRFTYLIDEYYARGLDAAQLDNAAKELSIIYQDVRFGWDEPEDVLWQLEMHILGNQSHRPQVQRAAWVIIAYFFERCDIFEAPPPHWQPTLPTPRGFE